jgi:hypothetical protein
MTLGSHFCCNAGTVHTWPEADLSGDREKGSPDDRHRAPPNSPNGHHLIPRSRLAAYAAHQTDSGTSPH